MGIVSSEKRYIDAVRELYPKSFFFDSEFDDTESDLAKIAELKGKEIFNFKNKMKELALESVLATCSEKTIADWERIYTENIRFDLMLTERKVLIHNRRAESLNIETLRSAASLYDARIEKVVFPHRAARFGSSLFGMTRIFDLRVLSVVYIYTSIDDETKKNEFEKSITSIMLANQTIYFIYSTQF